MSRRSLLLALLHVPLILPFVLVFGHVFASHSWSALLEFERMAVLAGNTIILCSIICLFAFPVGIALAVLLFKTDLPGRRVLRSMLGIALCVPLPLFALAWQSFGGGGWRPWSQGLLPAAIIHALAALPWVVWLTGLALLRVPPELEDDARTSASAVNALWNVTLRQALPGIALAALWVVMQAAGEIAVTDLVVARTFAEEIYTQFVLGGPDGLGRAVVVALPGTLLSLLVSGLILRRFSSWTTFASSARPTFIWSLGRYRWLAGTLVTLCIFGYMCVPLASLLRQTSGGDAGSLPRLFLELHRAAYLNASMLLDSLACALLAGLLCSAWALFSTLWASDSPRARTWLFVLVVALWAVPGPVLGFGLKESISLLMKVEDVLFGWTSFRPLADVLYFEPNPLPVLWAQIARLFPYAVAILWPAVRSIPRDLRESARVDGAPSWREFWSVVWPSVRGAFWTSTFAVSALAIGELAASKLVQIPGRTTFVQELFNQMHYGATATTASLALIQLLAPIALWGLIAWRWSRPRISLSPTPTSGPQHAS